MKRFLHLGMKAAVLFSMSCLWGGCGGRSPEHTDYRYTDTAMGTVIQQTVYCASEGEAREVFREVTELLQELEKDLLSWRLETSEVYAVNAAAGEKEGAPLSEELAEILEQCLEVYQDSEGAFDITMGPAVRLWNIDAWAAGQQQGEYPLPDPETLGQTMENCGSGRIRLEREALRIFMPRGMQLDLGAVGKGLALGKLGELLDSRPELSGAVISLGGSILTWGGKPDGSSWKVGIVNPRDTSSNVGVLSLEGQWCISTSGDYERYVEVDGVRYHHILDPATGYPAASGVRGVTILSKEGLLSDALSTACFILGPEEGMALAEHYGAEALFVLENGELVVSEGMKGYFGG